MRKLILPFFVVLSFYTTKAQWNYINVGTTNDLNSVFFTSADTGYIVGGTILKTTDAGSTWKATDSVYSTYFKSYANPPILRSVFFTNADSGIAVGSDILKTNNKGKTWTNLNFLLKMNMTTTSLNSVYFPDDKNGYIVGGANGLILGGTVILPFLETILKTTDGGSNWTSLTGPKTTQLNSVYFIDANIGYAVGDSGFIIKTTNGGTSWSILTSGTKQRLHAVYFIDANTGFVGTANGIILKTTDGGTSWTFGDTHNFYSINAIYFPNANTGYAVGDGCGYKTTDGGTTWTYAGNGLSFVTYNSVFFISTNVGYSVGQNGNFDKTIDGAASGTSVKELQLGATNIVFPNPVNFILYLKNSSPTALVSIYDLQGKLLINKQIINNQINVANLQTGMYVIKITDNNNNLVIDKFIKE